MYNLDSEQLISLLTALVVALAIMLLFAVIVCLVYKNKCDRLSLENWRLRRTIEKQTNLKSLSNAAYQEMLNVAFGTQRIE